MPTWSTIAAASRHSGLSKQALHRRVKTGKLATQTAPGQPLLVDLDQLPVKTERIPVNRESTGPVVDQSGCLPVDQSTGQVNRSTTEKPSPHLESTGPDVDSQPRSTAVNLWSTEQENRRLLLDLVRRQDDQLKALSEQVRTLSAPPPAWRTWLLVLVVAVVAGLVGSTLQELRDAKARAAAMEGIGRDLASQLREARGQLRDLEHDQLRDMIHASSPATSPTMTTGSNLEPPP